MKERARQVVTTNIADATAVLQQLAGLEAQIEAAAAIIAEALLSGHKLLACGNGGSAADASHLTTEFVCPLRPRTPCLPCDLAGLPWRRLDRYRQRLFLCRSVCQASTSIRKAGRCSGGVYHQLVTARMFFARWWRRKRLGVKTIAFLGRDGGECAGLADVELLVARQN